MSTSSIGITGIFQGNTHPTAVCKRNLSRVSPGKSNGALASMLWCTLGAPLWAEHPTRSWRESSRLAWSYAPGNKHRTQPASMTLQPFEHQSMLLGKNGSSHPSSLVGLCTSWRLPPFRRPWQAVRNRLEETNFSNFLTPRFFKKSWSQDLSFADLLIL